MVDRLDRKDQFPLRHFLYAIDCQKAVDTLLGMEGIVAGAAQALETASPHLNRLASKK